MKKTIAMILSVMMVLALVIVPSFATNATPDGTITIDNASVGESYTYYKIFDATYNATTGATSYTTNATIKDLIGANDPFDVSATADSNGKYAVTLKTGKGIDDIKTWIAANISAFTAGPATVASSNTVTFSGLAFGYYYITSSLGAVVTIDTNTPNVTVKDKNVTEPTAPEKDVDLDTAQIGDTVTFTVLFTASNYYKTTEGATAGDLITVYNFQDTPNGFDIVLNTLKVEIQQPGDAAFTDKTADVTDEAIDNAGVLTFSLAWANNGVSLYKNGTVIKVTYDGVLNADATDYATNEVEVSHNNGQNPQTDDTRVETYKLTVTKTDGTNTLSDAEFELYDAAPASASPMALVDITAAGATTKTYRPALAGETGTTTTIVAGVAEIVGLDGDTKYYLVETKAPDGYNLLTTPTEVEFKTTDATNNTVTYADVAQSVVNNVGVELPQTGGIGTTLFIVFGTLIALAAAVIIVTNKRAKNANV